MKTVETVPLSCFEYYNANGERRHLFNCLCDCQELDESFERLIPGGRQSSHNMKSVLLAVKDRCRIPWKGGARLVEKNSCLGAVLPVLLMALAAVNEALTYIVIIVTTAVIYESFRREAVYNSNFHAAWASSSVVSLFLIFELFVVPLLEILPEENLAVVGLLAAALVFMLKTQSKWSQRHKEGQPSYGCDLEGAQGTKLCKSCQTSVHGFHVYVVWLKCCVDKENRRYFVIFLVFTVILLSYTANLTLTTICFPFVFIGSIMLPYDCYDVYFTYSIGLMYVVAMYEFMVASAVFVALIYYSGALKFCRRCATGMFCKNTPHMNLDT